MRIIDLSAPIAPSPPDVPSYARVDMTRTSHAEGAAQIEALLQVPSDLLRNGEGWAVEEFTRLGTHAVTHVDAPWHYNSTIQGKRAATIDELPLEWFFSDGVVLDMTHKLDGEQVEAAEIEAALEVDRLHAQAAGHRAGADRPRRASTTSPITSCAAAPSRPRRLAGCSTRASG